MTDVKRRLMDAILPHVAFDGWSQAAFDAAARDAGVDPATARAACPRGALDLAVAFHLAGDAAMRAALAGADLDAMRVRERVAFAVRTRIEAAGDRETVRRAAALFALPQHAAEGARLIWGTADAIWDALGDPSDDVNWYSKRTLLAGVYSSTLLFWLGDQSEGNAASWDFLDRRIGDVMQIERLKGQMRQNPLTRGLMNGIDRALSGVRAPARAERRRNDLPGTLGQ